MVSLDNIVICEFDSRNSNLQRVLLPKDLLDMDGTPSSILFYEIANLGGGLKKDPRTLCNVLHRELDDGNGELGYHCHL